MWPIPCDLVFVLTIDIHATKQSNFNWRLNILNLNELSTYKWKKEMFVKLQDLDSMSCQEYCSFIREDMKHSRLTSLSISLLFWRSIFNSTLTCWIQVTCWHCNSLSFLRQSCFYSIIKTTNRAHLREYLPIFWGSSLPCCLSRPEKNSWMEKLMTLPQEEWRHLSGTCDVSKSEFWQLYPALSIKITKIWLIICIC